jgi:hypothetical protein
MSGEYVNDGLHAAKVRAVIDILAAGFPVPGRTGYALSSLEKIQLAGRVRDGGGARTSTLRRLVPKYHLHIYEGNRSIPIAVIDVIRTVQKDALAFCGMAGIPQ